MNGLYFFNQAQFTLVPENQTLSNL